MYWKKIIPITWNVHQIFIVTQYNISMIKFSKTLDHFLVIYKKKFNWFFLTFFYIYLPYKIILTYISLIKVFFYYNVLFLILNIKTIILYYSVRENHFTIFFFIRTNVFNCLTYIIMCSFIFIIYFVYTSVFTSELWIRTLLPTEYLNI